MNTDYTIDSVYLEKRGTDRIMNLLFRAVGDHYEIVKETGIRGGYRKIKVVHAGPSLRYAKELFKREENAACSCGFIPVRMHSRVDDQLRIDKMRRQQQEEDTIDRLKKGELKFKWASEGLERKFEV